MQALHDLKDEDLQGLTPEASLAAFAAADAAAAHPASQAQEIRLKDAKIEKITFELARLKAWKFGAKTEAMNAEQRRLFEETLAEDEASLQAQLAAAAGRRRRDGATAATNDATRKPRRQAAARAPAPRGAPPRARGHDLPDARTAASRWCASARTSASGWTSCRRSSSCTATSTASGPAGAASAWCRSRPSRRSSTAACPPAGLVAHTLISRFVDHLPYYRQEPINARSGVHTPRSTLAQLVRPRRRGAGAAVRRAQALRARRAGCCMPTRRRWRMLDPGAGKTKKAYVWAYARGAFDADAGRDLRLLPRTRGAVPDRVPGRRRWPGAATGWRGTLVRDEYAAYDERDRRPSTRAHRRRLPCAREDASSTSCCATRQRAPSPTEALQAHRADLPRRARARRR